MRRWRTVTVDKVKFRVLTGVMFTAVKQKPPTGSASIFLIETPDDVNNHHLAPDYKRESIRQAIKSKLDPAPAEFVEHQPMLCCHICAKAIMPLSLATEADKGRLRICDACIEDGTAQHMPHELARREKTSTTKSKKITKTKTKPTPMLHCQECSEPIKPMAEATTAELRQPALCETCKAKKRGSKKHETRKYRRR